MANLMLLLVLHKLLYKLMAPKEQTILINRRNLILDKIICKKYLFYYVKFFLKKIRDNSLIQAYRMFLLVAIFVILRTSYNFTCFLFAFSSSKGKKKIFS